MSKQYTSKKSLLQSRKQVKDTSFATLQDNIKEEVEAEIQDFLERLVKHPSVYGVVLLGGLGHRNYLDQFSDVDLSIFTNTKEARSLPLPFEFHYLTRAGRVLEFNIHQQVLEHEHRNIWDEAKKEAYSRGKIHYDPSGKVRTLINLKTKFNENEAVERLIYLVQQYEWRAQIHAVRACKRGFPQAGNDLLDESLDLLVEALYLLERRFRPHRKWRLIYMEQFTNVPKKIIRDIHKSKLTKAHTEAVVMGRLKLLDGVFDYIKSRISKLYPNFPDNPYEHFYVHNIQLNINPQAVKLVDEWKTRLTSEEYEKVKGLSSYHLPPNKQDILELLKTEYFDIYRRLV